MLHSYKQIVLLLIISLMFGSCASILAPRHQHVEIVTGSPNAKVSIDDEQIGEGSRVNTRLTKDFKSRQLIIEEEGFLPVHRVMVQNRRHPLYFLSWIPFGPPSFFMIPLYDLGVKGFNFESEYQADARQVPTLERGEDERYVFLSQSSFDISKDDFVHNRYSYRNYINNGSPFHYGQSQNIEIKGHGPTQRLNEILHKHNFIDTTDNIFKDITNTLYVRAEMTELEVDQVVSVMVGGVERFRDFFRSNAKIKWELFDVYEQKLYEEEFTVTSGEFVREELSDAVIASIENVIEISLFKFLDRTEVREKLKKGDPEDLAFDPYTIKRGKKPTNIEEAMSATVTVKKGRGHGSGCVVGTDGYIVTNFHVVAGKDDEDIMVILDGNKEYKAKLVRKNEFEDLALLKIDRQFEHTFDFSAGIRSRSGEDAYAIGTPASIQLGQTVNRGIISGLRTHNEREWIQSDVSVSPGNSGGALINNQGSILGIVSSKLVGYSVEGITFAIPASRVEPGLGLSR
jgi:serine protease Do